MAGLLLLCIGFSAFSQNSIPDGTGLSYIKSYTISEFEPGATLNSVFDFGYCAILSHPSLQELAMDIQCPNGQEVQMLNYTGGDTDLGEPFNGPWGVGYEYCWVGFPTNGTMGFEAQGQEILPSDSYASQSSLAGLIGCPLNGLWTIRINDNIIGNQGYFYIGNLDFGASTYRRTLLTGRVFLDENSNNQFDEGDFPMISQKILIGDGPEYCYTNDSGIFKKWVGIGSYSISQASPAALFEQNYPSEPNFYSAEVVSNAIDTIGELNFANTPTSSCPDLSVDVSIASTVRPGFDVLIYVNYTNFGTLPAENSYIEVELNENLTYISGGNLISQTGNILTFDIGNIGAFQSGVFSFLTNFPVNLDLVGSTVCVQAQIFPNDPCEDPATEWDRSSVSVDGDCDENTSVCFIISNTGDPGEGDMAGNSMYRIFEDNNLVHYANFILEGGESMEVCWPANGATIRLEADQRPFHPGNSHPQESIEMCGNGDFSTGQILLMPLDDQDDFVEIDCQIVVNSWDPNDKSVMPIGLNEEHLVDSMDMLEYQIRFQNTGSAPAVKVVLLDTISEHLDFSTFQHISASHDCTVEMIYPNIIKWTFRNIMLPPEETNEPESHGFVKFRIEQHDSNTLGTYFENTAGIYFDYNPPIITNTVYNTVGRTSVIILENPKIFTNNKVDVYPNPAQESVVFSSENENYNISIYDSKGICVKKIMSITKGQYSLDRGELNEGIYFYKITDTNGYNCSGKIIFK